MKADFASIYTAPDPRPYYTELGGLDYQIPEHGDRVFSRLLTHLGRVRDRQRRRVVDLCCSYGVNATVARFHRSFPDVVAHYTAPEAAELSTAELIERDHRWFGAAADPSLEVVGLDVAGPAVEYALRARLLDEGIVADLETDELDDEAAAALAGVDLVTVTGGIGYITERTVFRVLDACPPGAWFAALSLRWVDFSPIADEARRRGLHVERLEGVTFRQRRFADDAERAFATAEIERLGVESPPDDGYHHADLYLVRPASDARPPVADLVL